MKYILWCLSLLVLAGCKQAGPISQPDQSTTYHDLQPGEKAGYLVKIPSSSSGEPDAPAGYINQSGDTIVPVGTYAYCWTDTIFTFGIVWDQHKESFIGIDRSGRRLYEIQQYDNGPDWLSDGLFRILRNGKVGYADAKGYIRIEPRFACADPFENGKARVALECELIPDGEYTLQKSDAWFYINKQGVRL
jgi:hypothetical protein